MRYKQGAVIRKVIPFSRFTSFQGIFKVQFSIELIMESRHCQSLNIMGYFWYIKFMKYLSDQEEKNAIHWFSEAANIAKKALCQKAKCGTVIIKEGIIIGRGYNAPPLDDEKNRRCGDIRTGGKPKYDQTCCMHAEWRAIIDALKNNSDKVYGSKLYFTRVNNEGKQIKSGEPFCTVCSRLALDVGISKFILYHEDGICEYDTDEYDKLSYFYNN